MEQNAARVPVLPRRVAAVITVSALSRAAWAIAATTLGLTIAGIANIYLRNDFADQLWMPLLPILAMLLALGFLAFRPSWLSQLGYVVVGTGCVYVYVLVTVGMHPELLHESEGPFVFNRLALALVLVGTPSSRPQNALVWGILGYLFAEAATIVATTQSGIPPILGLGPTLALLNYTAAFLALTLIQRSQRGRIPDFLRLQAQARAVDAARARQQRTAALLHDTVLNDLAFVVNGPAQLDQRMIDRIRLDIATLGGPDAAEPVDRDIADPTDGLMRNRLTALVSDFQWRGLNVGITGGVAGVAHIAPEVVDAAIGALQAALENVLKHSGTTSAEVIVSHSEDNLTWTISDAGVGFDPARVAEDRLGLRGSIVGRVEAVGGTAKIWSSPGNGTSVLITMPFSAPLSPATRLPEFAKPEPGDA